MIVITLTATVPRGPLILTECKMSKLSTGDKLHCTPDFARELAAKYPENLTQGPHWDKAGKELAGGRWELEKAKPAAAASKPATPPAQATAPDGQKVAPAPATPESDAARKVKS